MNDIDTEVAVKIMEWELLTVGYFGTEDETRRQIELENWLDKVGIESVGYYWIDVEKDVWMNRQHWNPTENIAQAWQVVNKLLEKFPKLRIIISNLANSEWRCIIMPSHTSVYTIFKEADEETAPLAICKCALKVVEEG